MPKKCYNKPNRSKPRYFTAKDVERVTKSAISHGTDPVDTLRLILEVTGYKDEVCGLRSYINGYKVATELAAEIGGVLALAKAVTVIIEWLKGSAIVKIPGLNRLALAAVLVLLVVSKILTVIGALADAHDALERTDALLKQVCEGKPTT